ncbi:MAG: hypothetical protein JW705_01070 [Methanosarcinaceae archaeon]|nr:hypothetical protein [Methanosarcinaceae archaeon]
MKQNIELIKPTLEMKVSYTDFAMEWKKYNEQIIPYSARLSGESYENWVGDLCRFEKRKRVPMGLYLPILIFWLKMNAYWVY